MPLANAVGFVLERGKRMQELPAGGMLSVRLSAEALLARLPAGVELAAENAPELCAVAGPLDAIEKLEAELTKADVPTRRLVTSHAFHSAMMDPVIEPLRGQLERVQLRAPRIPILSTVTADWLTDEQAVDPRYWATHLRKPVRFAPAVARLLDDPRRVLVEIGPRASLSALARQAVTGKRARPVAVPSLADTPEREPEAITAALGQLWTLGVAVDWAAYDAHEVRRRVPLPTYPFEGVRHWVDAPAAGSTPATLPLAAHAVHSPQPAQATMSPTTLQPVPSSGAANAARKARLLGQVQQAVEDVSGVDVTGIEPEAPWLELGLDSLALTQLARQVQKSLGVKMTFRDVMERYPSVASLVAMLDEQLPADEPIEAAPAVGAAPAAVPGAHLAGEPSTYVRQVIDAQLQIMAQQLAVLGGGAVAGPSPAAAAPRSPVVAAPPARNEDEPAAGPVTYDVKKAFGAIARIHTRAEELTPQQRARLDAFIARYTARTARSKAYTTEHRGHMADPRVVNGFRPLTKELTYQLVIERSRGSRLWDIDGNEYVDVLSGLRHEHVRLAAGLPPRGGARAGRAGYEIGPQHVLAGEVAKLFCEVTGADRAAFCNTGSEAVMGAMRVARTVTGRSTIAIFTGAYHGIFDEVIVRGTRKLRTIPAAPGILPGVVAEHARARLRHAGVARHPARARRHAGRDRGRAGAEPAPGFRAGGVPARAARAHRADRGTALIFDEVVTGFRSHPRGAQGLFGIEADLASYGKVVGGGFSIGVIAGKRRFMDALDGGHWQYGDDFDPHRRRHLLRRHLRASSAGARSGQGRARRTCATRARRCRSGSPRAPPRWSTRSTATWRRARRAVQAEHVRVAVAQRVHRGSALRRPHLRDAARSRHPHPRQLPVLPHHRAQRRRHASDRRRVPRGRREMQAAGFFPTARPTVGVAAGRGGRRRAHRPVDRAAA